MSYRFLLRPKWMLGHVIILLCAVLFVNLAVWQYHRMHERAERNAVTRAQMAAAPTNIDKIDDLNRLGEWQRVRITGQWDDARPVFVRYPIQGGRTGYYALTPFVLNDGSIVVNTGFIPRPEGEMASLPDVGLSNVTTIEGYVRKEEHTTKPVEANAGDPPIPTVAAVDLDVLRTPMGTEILASRWVQLTGPARLDATVLPGPDLSGGPHKSYMLQWIAFTVLAIVGWIAVLIRTAREQPGALPMTEGLEVKL